MPDTPPSPPVRYALTVDHSPHWRASELAGRVFWTTIYAAALPLLAGFAYFGWRGLWVVGLSVASVLATDWLFVSLAGRPSLRQFGARPHTLLMGVLLGLTLPATAPWHVVVLAGVVTVVVGKGVLGGLGHYLWHPALLGRFVVQVLYPSELAPEKWAVLDRHHLFFGQLGNSGPAPVMHSYLEGAARGDAHALELSHPLSAVAEMVHGQAEWIHNALARAAEAGDSAGRAAGAVLYEALWARLPALKDMLVGGVGGGVGATCAIALVIGGLFLIFRGYLRWQLVFSFLLTVAIAAAVLPLRIAPPGGDPSLFWLPGFTFHDGMPVGPIYVAYHVIGGELLLGVFFFAGDMVSRPITKRGQLIFGIGCGLLTVLIRLYLFAPGAAFVAILLMNTATPLIDRITQPRAFGH